MSERRTTPRRKFEYYLRIVDDDTQEMLGHLVEVSSDGIQLDTTKPLLINQGHYLRVELTSELADRPFIIFLARTRWCKMDEIEPNLYHIGFGIVEIRPEDKEIFLHILAKYGK